MLKLTNFKNIKKRKKAIKTFFLFILICFRIFSLYRLKYVTDYIQSPNEEDGLKITLSNKKYKDTDIRNIADKIKEGSLAMKTIQRKSYILNETKYNRSNTKNYELDYIGGV